MAARLYYVIFGLECRLLGLRLREVKQVVSSVRIVYCRSAGGGIHEQGDLGNVKGDRQPGRSLEGGERLRAHLFANGRDPRAINEATVEYWEPSGSGRRGFAFRAEVRVHLPRSVRRTLTFLPVVDNL